MLPRDKITKILTQTFETKFNYKIDSLLFSNNSTVLISISKDIFYIDQTIITDIHTSLANQFRKLNHDIKIQNIHYHNLSKYIMVNFYFNIYKIEDSVKLIKLKSTNNLDRVTYNSSLDIDLSININNYKNITKWHIASSSNRAAGLFKDYFIDKLNEK